MSRLALVADHGAPQQRQGTFALRPVPRRRRMALWFERPFRTGYACLPPGMTTQPKPRQFFIQGVAHAGKTLRPSDWAERLAGALSSLRPEGGASGIAAHIGYSPLCVPREVGGVKCVIVSEALRDVEPMAWDFAMHFARDNDLPCVEGCLLPDSPE